MPALIRRFAIIAGADGLILQPHKHDRTTSSHSSRAGSGTASPITSTATTGLPTQTPQPIKIDYKTRRITSTGVTNLAASTAATGAALETIEAFGLVGLFNVASQAFLVGVTQREMVASVCGKAVYVITGVVVVPLSGGQEEAAAAIRGAKVKGAAGRDFSGSEEEEDGSGSECEDEGERRVSTEVEDVDVDVEDPDRNEHAIAGGDSSTSVDRIPGANSRVAQDVLEKKGQYGRFAARWFSRKGWAAERRRSAGMSSTELPRSPSFPKKDFEEAKKEEVKESVGASTTAGGDIEAAKKPQPQPLPAVGELTSTLLPKLLRSTKMLFSSRNFFFSYDFDITRSIGSQDLNKSQPPSYQSVDPFYFWNRHLVQPFIDSNQSSFALPLMQGFVGQSAFSIKAAASEEKPAEIAKASDDQDKIEAMPDKDAPLQAVADLSLTPSENFVLTLISRRSIKRPGLRYLRRGVDDEGNTANTVETEQILARPSWTGKLYSYVQMRGSIPLYFSQSPYSLKPIPVMRHSEAVNAAAFERHFAKVTQRYGKTQAVVLVDKHGGEKLIGDEYERYTEKLNGKGGVSGTQKIGFEWFDFHRECRGMKFENVSILMGKLEGTMEEFGDTRIEDGACVRKQEGVLRTNCMDCLDRTNVMQSAFAQRALEHELRAEGLQIDFQTDRTTQWFNVLWADNGDAISKQYSSTAALKGDFTRTRKRDYRGALNDFGLTLTRYYNNMVNDYFSQACIDFLLGNVTARVFEEFESNMMSADPGISIEKVRQNAIDICSKMVISSPGEELLGGWTLLCPQQPNTLRTFPLEESVLLLTNAAVYSCRLDWATDKVLSFERADLENITQINCGTYITSTFTQSETDPKRNVGLVLVYCPGKDSVMRVNTRSLQSAVDQDQDNVVANAKSDNDEPPAPAVAAAAASTADPSTQPTDETEPATNPTPAQEEPSKPQPASSSDWGIYNLFSRASTSKPPSRILAFKALPSNSPSTPNSTSSSDENDHDSIAVSELDTVRSVCAEIERAIRSAKMSTATKTTTSSDAENEGVKVEETDILSLEDARRRTGYLETLGHEIKRLVWA